MRLLILTVLIFSIYTFGCSSQNMNITGEKDNACVVSDSNYCDFGQAREGAVLKHTFVLTNHSSGDLQIEGVNTSCGCTVSRIQKKLLAPGEKTPLEVEFDTEGYYGPTKQFIYVNTKDPDNPVLRFIVSADILKK